MTRQVWTTKSILDWTRDYLEGKGIENPKLSAEWLIAHATKLSRIELYTNFDRPLSTDELDLLHSYIVRRATGEPLQYITNTASFRYLDLHIEPGVLIPRPETEVLVSEVLKELDSIADEKLVVDVCCGSGCIACALAAERDDIHVIASDISEAAVGLTKRNLDKHKLSTRVEVLKGDLLSPVDKALYGCFDCVVSNPPYIPSSILANLPNEVSEFEPVLALDGGEDGLNIFRRLLTDSLEILKPHGLLAVELHEESLDDAYDMAIQAGYIDARIENDLAGKPRILIARKG